MKRRILLIILSSLFVICSFAFSEDKEPLLRIGYIGSLSGFAASYGQAVLDGVQLAVAELEAEGQNIELFIEDDQSITKNTISAYTKLRTVDHIHALIGGSWWVNSIAKQTEAHGIPFLSCETLYNKDFVKAKTYFSLAGDLRDWINIFQPYFNKKGFHSAVTVKFSSGFGDTLAEEMKRMYSKETYKYLGDLEYSDIHMSEAGTLVTRLSKLSPDVVYFDGQPASFITFMKRLNELDLSTITILTNSIADTVLTDNLLDPLSIVNPLVFTKRESFTDSFSQKYSSFHHKKPTLSADLGYYAVRLFNVAFKEGRDGALTRIKAGGIAVDDMQFQFDENNVWHGISQEVWELKNGRVVVSDVN